MHRLLSSKVTETCTITTYRSIVVTCTVTLCFSCILPHRPRSLRDKYVEKNVMFEDPLFPADDSSLFYSRKPSMKIEWKRPCTG
uniref:Calpain catalytic domain-containing protein n=1 Tax=Maylandia zebra TaxID=106582 RepID=A0A3P9DS25_9CICH